MEYLERPETVKMTLVLIFNYYIIIFLPNILQLVLQHIISLHEIIYT